MIVKNLIKISSLSFCLLVKKMLLSIKKALFRHTFFFFTLKNIKRKSLSSRWGGIGQTKNNLRKQ